MSPTKRHVIWDTSDPQWPGNTSPVTGAMTGTGGAGDVSGTGVGNWAATYTNQPAGMTEISRWDGTTTTLPAGWTTWAGWETVQVVTDATNPAGTGSALEFTYAAGSQDAGNAQLNDFGGDQNEVYVMYRLFYPNSWDTSIGMKHYYWGNSISDRGGAGPTQYYNTLEVGHSQADVTDQWANPGDLLSMGTAWSGTLGTWVSMEMHMVAESAVDAGDGEVRYYLNGTLIGENTAVNWSRPTDTVAGFNGIQIYNNRNSAYASEVWFRVGELYISGK